MPKIKPEIRAAFYATFWLVAMIAVVCLIIFVYVTNVVLLGYLIAGTVAVVILTFVWRELYYSTLTLYNIENKP